MPDDLGHFRACMDCWSSSRTHPASTDSPAEGGAVAWMIEDLILPQTTFTQDGGYARRRAEYRYEGEETARVTPLFTRPAPNPSAFLFAPDELPKGDRSQFNAFALADRIIALTGEG